MKRTLRKVIRDYIGMSRYLALGSLDGILTVLSISVTASLMSIASRGNANPTNIGLTGLSGGVAIALSNGFGSYIGEHAEEGKIIRELESKMILKERSLDDTIIQQQAKYRVYLSVLTHGSSSFMGSLIPSVPFFILKDIYTAIAVSVIICFILLITLGAYLGKISRESKIRSVVQVVIVGMLIVVISYLISGG